MKAFLLTLSLVFTVLILILAFENISSQCSGLLFLFFPVRQSPTIVFLAIAVLGMMTGALYHAFWKLMLATSEEEEDEL